MTLTNIDLAYFAGIIDADGTICISKSEHPANTSTGCKFTLMVQVGQADEWLPFALQDAFGGSVNEDKRQYERYDNASKFLVWTVSSQLALKFLTAVVDYLHMKKPQAEIAIAFQEKRRRGKKKTTEEWATEEAQKILVSSMNKKGGRK